MGSGGGRGTGGGAGPAMLARARARLPAATWIEHDMRSLALGARFAAIVAWDSFFHLRRAAQRGMFPVLRDHLVVGGLLLFTSGPAAGAPPPAVRGRWRATSAPLTGGRAGARAPRGPPARPRGRLRTLRAGLDQARAPVPAQPKRRLIACQEYQG